MRTGSSLFVLSAWGVVGIGRPVTCAAQSASVAPHEEMLSPLQKIEKTMEARRQELHVPGVAFAIVKDDKVIYSHGFGMRDVGKQLPVTSDTLFAIGSSTKAFTAMTMMMSADEGKLKLTDSPRKYLPYFHLQDPEADQQITLGDILCHRSGLARTDMLWASGTLNSEQLIRALADVKPTAKLGEKFQYQNIMFLTAGQVVAKVQRSPWTDVVAKRIFRPLGMSQTDTTNTAMEKSPDCALGYTWNGEKKEYVHLPMRDIRVCAPAGAINSNVNDMVKWVQFMLDGGVWNGKRLVSEQSFAELTVPRITVQGDMKYGYGWFLRNWNGHKVVEHGGNIDGFNAEVALMPDQHLGFVMLTNVSASSLGETALQTVWENLVPKPVGDDAASAGSAVTPAQAAGAYHSEELSIDFQVTAKDGQLTAQRVGSQNVLTLQVDANHRYKVGAPAPADTYIAFRLAKDATAAEEMVLDQNGTRMVFKRAKTTGGNTQAESASEGPLKELIGPYKATNAPVTFEVAVREGKVAFLVPGQPAYPLIEKAKDTYALGPLPADFALLIHRDAAGKVIGATLKQPPAQGNLEMTFGTVKPAADLPSIDEVMQKHVAAEGGEAALRRHHSHIMGMRFETPNQGVTGTIVSRAKAPNAEYIETSVFAQKKKIFQTRDYFDGQAGATWSSLSALKPKSSMEIATSQFTSAFYATLDWKTLYKSASVTGRAKVGEEECYIVELKPPVGNPILQYLSAKTFLLLKQNTISGALATVETFSDYRLVDGVQIPFRRISNDPINGETITIVTKVRFNVNLPASTFRPPTVPAL